MSESRYTCTYNPPGLAVLPPANSSETNTSTDAVHTRELWAEVLTDVDGSSPLNVFTSALRYSNPFRNANAMNE